MKKQSFKIVFLGDQSVGKTSIIHRFKYDQFEDNYNATIGIDFITQKMYIEDRTITLNLWDTAGQEKFKSLIPSYIKDSQAVVVVFDITNQDSFESIGKWIEDARALRDEDQALVVIAGNKIDMDNERQVTHEDATKFAAEKGIPFYEVSALSGQNVQVMFNDIAKQLTGIQVDLIKQPNAITRNQEGANPATAAATSAPTTYEQNMDNK